MSKYWVKVNVTCRNDIKLYTDDKEKLNELEKDAVTQAFLHERTCKLCADIKWMREQREKEDALYRVQSVARCGEILFVEHTNPSEVRKTQMERNVCQQVAEHRRNCIKCIRIEKLDKIKNLTI